VTCEADDTYLLHLHNAGAEVKSSLRIPRKLRVQVQTFLIQLHARGLFNPREQPPIPNAQEAGSFPDVLWKFYGREKSPASAGNQTPVRPEGLGKLGNGLGKLYATDCVGLTI
jgi:hypothetical protein